MGLYTPIQNCIRIGLFIVAFVVVIVSLVHKPKIKKAFMVAIGIAVFSLFFPQWEIYKDGGTVELWSPVYQIIHWKTSENNSKNGLEIHFFPNNFHTIGEWRLK